MLATKMASASYRLTCLEKATIIFVSRTLQALRHDLAVPGRRRTKLLAAYATRGYGRRYAMAV